MRRCATTLRRYKADPQPEATLSCAELVERGDQQLLVNDFVAAIAGQYVHRLLHREPITTFLTYVNTADLVVTSKRICREELAVYLERT